MENKYLVEIEKQAGLANTFGSVLSEVGAGLRSVGKTAVKTSNVAMGGNTARMLEGTSMNAAGKAFLAKQKAGLPQAIKSIHAGDNGLISRQALKQAPGESLAGFKQRKGLSRGAEYASNGTTAADQAIIGKRVRSRTNADLGKIKKNLNPLANLQQAKVSPLGAPKALDNTLAQNAVQQNAARVKLGLGVVGAGLAYKGATGITNSNNNQQGYY